MDRPGETVLELPSGVHLILEDTDEKLQEYFRQLFGSTETGAAVIVSINRRGVSSADKQQHVHKRQTDKSQRTSRKSRNG